MKRSTPTSRFVLLAAALWLTPIAAGGARKPRPKRMSEAQLLSLMRAALSPRASLARLARRIDRRLRKADKLPFVAENTDELHPALSTPWDLPKIEYPRRAVLRFAVRVFGKAAELRLVAPLAALQDDKRAALATATDTNLVLMVTVRQRGGEFPLGAVARLASRLRTSVYLSGHLGNCKAAAQWCHSRGHSILAHGAGRGAKLLLELASPEGDVGGFKLVALPRGSRPR